MPEPDWTAIVRSRLASDRVSDDIVEEIAQHAGEVYRAALDAGESAGGARAMVDAEMHDVPALLRAARAATARRRLPAAPEPAPPGRLQWVSSFARDVTHGARLLAARPAFTAVAIATLALGIGANTAIFSVVDSLLLEPLPFPDPGRLVMVWETDAADPSRTFIVAAPNFEDWQKQSASFSSMAIWEDLRFNIAGDGEPEQVHGLRVSGSVFRTLGVPPQLGRTFGPAEDAPGHDVVVISDGLWRRRYAADPRIVGHTMRLSGKPFEIIGVMPPSFAFTGRPYAVWVPIAYNAQDAQRGSHSFYAAARLRDGVSFESARAEVQTIGARLAQRYPDDNRGESATITRMSDLGVAELRPTLLALSGTVGLVLLIACVNVANLLLAQSSARRREFAIRAALGASRGRLASQVLAEGLLLAGAGAAAGVGVAWAGTMALAGSLPAAIRLAPFRDAGPAPLDPAVLTFTCAIAGAAGVLFSLAPLVGLSRTTSGSSLKNAGDRGSTAVFTAARSALVAVEVALAVVVLAAAGLMIKSMARLVAVDPGVRTDHVLTMTIALPQDDTYGPPERTTFCEDLRREAGAVPGVAVVSAISHLPLSGANASRGITIEGRPVPPDGGPGAAYRLTCPGYFAALGIPILRGRDFTAADSTRAPGVVIINEAMAARYWPEGDPLGQRIKLGDPDSTNPWLTVVGVVRNVRHFGLDSDAIREMFRPYSQAAWPLMTVTARTEVEPLSLAASLKAAVARIEPANPVSRIRSMEQVLDESTGPRRFPMLLLSLFSVVALVLAVIGVYGVVSYVVSQRSREIGIRIALGAGAAQVTGMVMRRTLAPIAVGIGAGVFGAHLASRLLTSMLFDVRPGDPAVLGAIVALLTASGLLASLIPARRAAAIDPLIALKEE